MKEPDLSVPEHSDVSFTWSSDGGAAYASDLGRLHASRVWSDAPGVGFFMVSREGCKKLFLLRHTLVAPGGTLLAEVFAPANGSPVDVLVYDD